MENSLEKSIMAFELFGGLLFYFRWLLLRVNGLCVLKTIKSGGRGFFSVCHLVSLSMVC